MILHATRTPFSLLPAMTLHLLEHNFGSFNEHALQLWSFEAKGAHVGTRTFPMQPPNMTNQTTNCTDESINEERGKLTHCVSKPARSCDRHVRPRTGLWNPRDQNLSARTLTCPAIKGLFDCLDVKKVQSNGEQTLSGINSLKLKGTFHKAKTNPHVDSIPAVDFFVTRFDETLCVSLKAMDWSENHLGGEGFSHVVWFGQSPPVWMGSPPFWRTGPSHFAPTVKQGAPRNAKPNEHQNCPTVHPVCMPSRVQSSPEPPCSRARDPQNC